jgi:hypothetical protein
MFSTIKSIFGRSKNKTKGLVNKQLYVGRLVWIKFLNVETNVRIFVEDFCTVDDVQKKLQEHIKRYPGGTVIITDKQGNPIEPTMLLSKSKTPYFAKIKITNTKELSNAKKEAVAFIKETCINSMGTRFHSCILEAPEAGFLPSLYVQIRKNDVQDKYGFYESGSNEDVAEARQVLPTNYKGFPIKVVKLEYDEITIL